MTVEKIAGVSGFAGVEERGSRVTRRSSRPVDQVTNWTFGTILVALSNLITAGSDVMAEAHRMRREAQRRYPHLNFDA